MISTRTHGWVDSFVGDEIILPSQDVIDSLFAYVEDVEVLTCFLVLSIFFYDYKINYYIYVHLCVYYVGMLIYMLFVLVIFL